MMLLQSKRPTSVVLTSEMFIIVQPSMFDYIDKPGLHMKHEIIEVISWCTQVASLQLGQADVTGLIMRSRRKILWPLLENE